MLDQRIFEIIKEGKGFVAILAGSGSDDKSPEQKPGEREKPLSHIGKIVKGLDSFEIPYGVNIYSAHKQPADVENIISIYNRLTYPLLIVAVAGGTDALSGTASWSSLHPVVSCPPDGFNMSCLTNPPGSSNAYIQRPENVAKFAAQMFAHLTPKHEYASALKFDIDKKVRSLYEDNTGISEKYLSRMLEMRGGK